jgi:protein TonB
MMEWLRGTRREIATFYYETYDVEIPVEPDKPQEEKEPEPPPPEPEPEPEQPKPDLPPPIDDPYKEQPPPPPAAAKAQEVLTAKNDDRLDFGDEGFVSGQGDGGIGYVSSEGTAKEAKNPRAKPGGTPGASGTGEPGAAPPPPGPDLSRPPTLAGSSSWNCPFPPEADAAQIDQAVAVVVVTVRPDGTPQSVKVVTDPGNGFGRAARTCALGRRYKPGLDRAGQPTTSASPPIRVRFTR